jgi:8-oxo-dGTP pyrophosphatase MutT (NUDIX family)
MRELTEKGNWGNNIAWELYRSDEQPDANLCTAVFCLGIMNQKIILMRAKRGWGMTGGHIEVGETLEQALIRESQEEGGFTPINPKLYGYRKITSTIPITHQDGITTYPFPTSYILYYWSVITGEVKSSTGDEVLESRPFSLDEIRKINITDQTTIELGWQSYLKK